MKPIKGIQLLAFAALTNIASAATVTTHVLVNFDGTLSGTTYTLGAGEIDTTGTFVANGSPTVNLGLASLAGGGSADGFRFNPSAIGSLTSQNWIAEAIVSHSAFQTGQRTMISVQGDLDFRLNNGATQLEAGYWDGSTFGAVSAPLPTAGTFAHYALVWDAATTSLTAYIDGASIGTVDNNAFATPDASYVSFGYFGRDGFVGRSITGDLDSVAFSTFTGTFDPSADFTIPEPSAALLGGLGLFALLRRRRA